MPSGPLLENLNLALLFYYSPQFHWGAESWNSLHCHGTSGTPTLYLTQHFFKCLRYYSNQWNQASIHKRLKWISLIIIYTWPLALKESLLIIFSSLAALSPNLCYQEAKRLTPGPTLLLRMINSNYTLQVKTFLHILGETSLEENIKIFVFILVILPATSLGQKIFV